ncbi:hypothetical protein ACN1C3_30215 [Pseudomonas sp. H11T01]|uniref:hypothetical protein n=1 Tax=Pseudomonas sp. H11T01 TaxID=3402749 RepID=UPI003ACF1F01
MTALIFSTTHPETEARILIAALQQWLEDQPEHPLSVSKTNFSYNNGVLESVTIIMGVVKK